MLKPLPPPYPEPFEAADPHMRVAQANGIARFRPTRADCLNAIQVYPYSPVALPQVYAALGETTDIELERGEQFMESGSVAAGETVRWIMGDKMSGIGPTRRTQRPCLG